LLYPHDMSQAATFRGRLVAGAKELLREAMRTSYELFKITVPISIAIRLLALAGMIERLGDALAPVMSLVGLPGSMGLVWATAMISNIYGAMIAFAGIAPAEGLTTAQVTVLCTMMLVAHGLPVELRIAQKAGTRLRFMFVLRVAGALAVGWALHQAYSLGGVLQTANVALFRPPPPDPSWAAWLANTGVNLLYIFAIILALLVGLKLLERLGATALLMRLLGPVLRVLGMSRDAAPITIIGMTMGLTYGGGLIIRQATSGKLGRRDVLYSLTLMGLSHSLIEDTLLMAALGAHHSGVLWGRLAFSLTAVFVLVRLLARASDKTLDRFFCRPVKQAGPPPPDQA